MTKGQYIKAYPKSELTAKLKKNNWPMNGQITIGSGQVAPETAQSKLCHALAHSRKNLFIVGGRAGKYWSDGHHWAVR